MNRKIAVKSAAVLGLAAAALVGCSTDADVATNNVSQDADNFKVPRRIVFYNGITDTYMFTVEGYCSVKPDDAGNKLDVICKTDQGIKKHMLGKSDNVTWFMEQMAPADVSTSHYKVTFKPSAIIPSVEAR